MLDYLGMASENINPELYIKESKKRKAERDAEEAREASRDAYGKKTAYDLDEDIRAITEILAMPPAQKHEAYRQYMTAHGENPDTLGVYLNDAEKKRVGLKKDEVCSFFEVGRHGIYSIEDVMRRNAKICPELNLRVEQVTDIAGTSYFIMIGADVETMNLLTRKYYLEQGKYKTEQRSQNSMQQPQAQESGKLSVSQPVEQMQQQVQQPPQQPQAQGVGTAVSAPQLAQRQMPQQPWQDKVAFDRNATPQVQMPTQQQKQGNAPSGKFASRQAPAASYVDREHARNSAQDHTPTTHDR